ncbi:MAG: glycosyltransferase family 2 protein [Sphingobacteriales bacterium]|nr:glycosyltransferase family 2 protein [Sphingobacteriales bacterium]
MYILRIIEKLLIIYYLSYFAIDILLYLIFIISISSSKKRKSERENIPELSVSIIVPAYNEEVSIVNCIEMLRNLDYPDYEIIVVNDGSSDRTMEILLETYQPQKLEILSGTDFIKTSEIRQLYLKEGTNLKFIDKENGGKADAINAGINYSVKDFICTIDADSILDKNALHHVMKQFEQREETFVAGGQLAAANGVVIENNRVKSLKMPSNLWVLWQITEYIKSFLISRIGLGKMNALLVMSGAFSVFRKSDLLAAGGYLSQKNDHPYLVQTIGKHKKTLCEDMEVVVRLWRFKHENRQKAKAVFLPQPVCWTEVPDNGRNLYKQRVRWHTGLAESLFFHLKMLFEPSYKATGMFAMPYYFFFELMSPLMKVVTVLFIIPASVTGLINLSWVIMLIIGTTLITAIITSSMTVITEYWSYRQDEANRSALRYRSFREWLLLILSSIMSDFSYSFFRSFAQLHGLVNFALKKSSWNKFERKGIKRV